MAVAVTAESERKGCKSYDDNPTFV